MNNMCQEDFTVENHNMRLSKVMLNNALTACERGLHSSLLSDYLLSQSVQALNMPKFPKLSIDLL